MTEVGQASWPVGLVILASLLSAACGRYSDFTLPPIAGGDPAASFAFDALPDPVLTRGDFADVLNPSVVRAAAPGPALLNLYSAFDGRTWHTALAISEDGLRWQPQGVVLSPDPQIWESTYIAANGSALFYNSQFWYWYESGARDTFRIGLARSRDAKSWRKEPAPVLDLGPAGSWDEKDIADPYVIRIDPYFYMYYLGQDRGRRQRLGVARSTDGIRWEKLRANPILELGADGAFDEVGLGEPAVWKSHGFYWMLYRGRDVAEYRRLGLARSTDGVHWRKLPTVFAGSAAWDAKVICDPTVMVDGDVVKVWFGGGDVASPDENLHGQIGFATLRPVPSPR